MAITFEEPCTITDAYRRESMGNGTYRESHDMIDTNVDDFDSLAFDGKGNTQVECDMFTELMNGRAF